MNHLLEIARTATLLETVDYPATCYTLIESDHPITLPEGSQIAVERPKHRGYRMFSTHQIGYDKKEGAYGFALGSSLTSHSRPKEFFFALPFGQKVKIAGLLFTLQPAANQNIRFEPIAE